MDVRLYAVWNLPEDLIGTQDILGKTRGSWLASNGPMEVTDGKPL